MPSRQERRQAERDAAKRTPAKAEAAGVGAAAAALANIDLNPLGDWNTQAEDAHVLRRALGVPMLKQRASEAGAYTRSVHSST
jgi:hypothetical protein